MEKIDLSSLERNAKEYFELSNSLREKYNCNWNDTVHDSYKYYVKQVEELSIELRKIKNNSISILREVDSVDLNRLEKKVDSLKNEVDSL